MSGDITVPLSYEERILNALARVEHRRGDGGITRDTKDAAAIREALAPLYVERDRLRAALLQLQRWGSPGRPEQACWCAKHVRAEHRHSPGCRAARAILAEGA